MMFIDDIRRHIQTKAADDEQFKRLVTSVAGAIGYDLARITRKSWVAHCRALIQELAPQ